MLSRFNALRFNPLSVQRSSIQPSLDSTLSRFNPLLIQPSLDSTLSWFNTLSLQHSLASTLFISNVFYIQCSLHSMLSTFNALSTYQWYKYSIANPDVIFIFSPTQSQDPLSSVNISTSSQSFRTPRRSKGIVANIISAVCSYTNLTTSHSVNMSETRGKGTGKANQPDAPLTSGDLNYPQQRKWMRMQRAKAVMEKVLSNTPAFTSLAANKQALAREEIVDLLSENM